MSTCRPIWVFGFSVREIFLLSTGVVVFGLPRLGWFCMFGKLEEGAITDCRRGLRPTEGGAGVWFT